MNVLRELIDERFDGECRLRTPWCPIRARADMIRLDTEGLDIDRVPVVGTRDQHSGDAVDRPLGEGTGIEDELCLYRREAACGRRADLELDDAALRGVGHGHVLAPRQREPDRPTKLSGGGGHDRVDDDDLASEATPERRAGDADVCRWHVEDLGQLRPHVVGALCRRADLEPAGRGRDGRGDLRFEIGLVDPPRLERATPPDIARRERLVHLPLAMANVADDVGRPASRLF